MGILTYSKKIKAGSMMETIVAMVILVGVISICYAIYLNVLESSQPHNRIFLKGRLSEYVSQCKVSQHFMDERLESKDYTIQSTVANSKWPNLVQWTVTVTNGKLPLHIEHHELIALHDE